MTDGSGYSGTPLWKKLGLKPGLRVCAIDPPQPYATLVPGAPAPLLLVAQADTGVALAHLFVVERAVLARQLAALRRTLAPDAVLWVSWPKKAARRPTDISEDVIRAEALPLGYVDVKVCAVDATWSGLKLVVRRELRPTR